MLHRFYKPLLLWRLLWTTYNEAFLHIFWLTFKSVDSFLLRHEHINFLSYALKTQKSFSCEKWGLHSLETKKNFLSHIYILTLSLYTLDVRRIIAMVNFLVHFFAISFSHLRHWDSQKKALNNIFQSKLFFLWSN